MTTERQTRLLEAHTAFLLAQLSGDALKRQIALETEAAYERLATLTLNDIVTPSVVADVMVEQLRHSPVTPASRDLVMTLVRVFRASEQNSRLRASDFLSKRDYEHVVDRFAAMRDLRQRLIHGALSSPLYGGLVSDVLFNGIRDYLLSDNSMAMKIPGMGSLMKMGKWGLDKTMPNLEQSLEKTLKGYIEANISRTLGLSEKFLDNALDTDNIRKLSDHVWTLINEPTVRQVLDVVPDKDIESAVVFVEEAWQTLRHNPHLAQWIVDAVEGFFAAYGAQPLGPWLEALGWTQSHVTVQLQQWGPSLVERPVVQEYLRERIHAQLAAFYQSDMAQSLLA